MKTRKIKASEYKDILPYLQNGEVIGFPTETVYGLAIVYDNAKAFEKLALAKNRPIDKPISMMVASLEHIEDVAYVDERAKKVINTFMPGAITIILNAKETLPYHVTLGRKTIGIRIPTNQVALNILKAMNKPLLVTSANLAASPSLMKAEDVKSTFDGIIAAYIDEDAIQGIASTVVNLVDDEIKIVREGPISLKQIQECVEENI